METVLCIALPIAFALGILIGRCRGYSEGWERGFNAGCIYQSKIPPGEEIPTNVVEW